MNHFVEKAAKVLALSAITAAFLAVSVFAAEDALATGVGVTTGSGLNLRSEPSTEASIVTTLEKDLTVAILDSAEEGWYRVAYNGKSGYVSSEFLVQADNSAFETYGRVNASGVNVRDMASLDGEVLNNLGLGSGVTVIGLENGWYSITSTYGDGYIRSDYISLTNSEPAAPGSSSGVVDFARQFLGTRYSYGGASPSGFDCSGFTMYVYKQFGFSLPHTATGQWQSGLGTRVYSLGELQPGDLVFFNDPSRNAGKACSHAGIYIGGGQMIHSSSSRSGGVIYSDLTSGYYNTYFVGGIHV
ncbi:MAG: SH3 domain-containing protein [Oscillibacter sp.]|nr:SH3 domain-containing protein [Oscillibacter sp.]